MAERRLAVIAIGGNSLIKDKAHQTVEDQYQAAKKFEDGSTGLNWRKAKGRKAVNQEECAALYSELWTTYIIEHPELHDTLMEAEGLSDMFGQPGRVCP